MHRRTFFRSLAAASAAAAVKPQPALAAIPKTKIIRVRVYAPPEPNPLFNQSDLVVAIETDAGITGIGEGGSKEMLEQCAGRLIGQDPQYIERLWQDMSRAFFYPPGREKEHALGALDLALWDIRGKALGVPVHALLGGLARNYCECYITGGVGGGPTLKEKAQAAIAAGYRAFRLDAASVNGGTTFNARERIHQVRRDCEQVREGVGKDGDWLIDFHQRFDFSDALRGCKLLEDLEPFLVEDPVRTGSSTRNGSRSSSNLHPRRASAKSKR